MNEGAIGFLIIVANFIVSYKGFKNHVFFEQYKFEVDPILIGKDYKRIITSGFLHANWMHLCLNMVSLFAFAKLVEHDLGGGKFLLIYFSSLIGGGLFSLYVHRNHPDYSAIGASGAVCGVIFAAIALFPGMEISLFGLQYYIQSWLYGILFVVISIYGIKSQKDNIGHEAHLGGALIGMIVALLIQPIAFVNNYKTILLIVIPVVAFIYLISVKPHILFIDNFYFKKHKNYFTVDQKYTEEKVKNVGEIDRILDKISNKGIDSLTQKEKDALKRHSQSVK